jgi:hypothetical protein
MVIAVIVLSAFTGSCFAPVALPATIAAMQESTSQLRPLDIAEYWRSVQGDLVHIVDLYSDGNLNWTPKESL